MRIPVLMDGEKGIVLPKGMDLDQAISVLESQKDLDTYGDKEVTMEETVKRFPFEAAYALSKAIEELHGESIQHDVYLKDGSRIDAKLIGIPTSVTETVQVPWGPFAIPGIEGDFETLQALNDGVAVLIIKARIKRKYKGEVEKLAARTREIAEQHSIYRGKCIKVRFRNDKGELEVKPPTFLDTSHELKAIFSKEVQRKITANILIPIKKSEHLKKLRIPLKRGALLVGTYGSGKTLTAYMLAKESQAVGRTFIYVENSAELPDALRFAASYSPALVFAEDIDRITIGTRTLDMDRLLNTIDGVDNKNVDAVTVLTTNNLELIHPAFLREGRTDSIITIDEPDADAVTALIRHFAGDLLDAKADLSRISSSMVGRTPAFIREVVERSKLELLIDSNGSLDDVSSFKLNPRDLENAYHRHKDEREGVETAMREGDEMRTIVQTMMARGIEGEVRSARRGR